MTTAARRAVLAEVASRIPALDRPAALVPERGLLLLDGIFPSVTSCASTGTSWSSSMCRSR